MLLLDKFHQYSKFAAGG